MTFLPLKNLSEGKLKGEHIRKYQVRDCKHLGLAGLAREDRKRISFFIDGKKHLT